MLNFPRSLKGEEVFYIFHETTDFLLLTFLLYTLRTREYIPYFGVINLDNDNLDNSQIEDQQPMLNVLSYQYVVNPQTYK